MKLRIVTDREDGYTRVETLDGREVTGVESVHVFAQGDAEPKAVITVTSPEVDVEADRIGRGKQHGEQWG